LNDDFARAAEKFGARDDGWIKREARAGLAVSEVCGH